MTRTRRASAFVSTFVLLASQVLALGVAHGAPPPATSASAPNPKAAEADALAHFRRGVELYEENDFNAALVEFKRAYETAPNPRVLYNIGQTHYQLQSYAPALETFERYLAEAGASVTADRKKEVEADIAKLRNRVAKAAIVVNLAGADVFIDDALVGKSPVEANVLVSMGRRKISASKPGFVAATRTVDFAGGDSTRITLELVPERKETREPVRAQSEGMPLAIPWAGVGVLAAGAVTTGILALSAAADVDDREGRFGETRASLDAAQTKAQNLALATDILVGATVVLAGVSLYATLTRGKSSRDESSRSADVVVSPRGAFVVGRF